METRPTLPPSDPLTQVAAELALDRLRGRAEPVAAAARRLRDEVDRMAETLTARQESNDRLRNRGDDPVPVTAKHGEVQRLRDTLQTLAASATRLEAEVGRIREVSERNAEVLGGSEVGYEAREAAATVGAFSRHLILAGSHLDVYEPFGIEQVHRLAEVLEAALADLGAEYDPGAGSRRRLRGRG